VEAACLGLSIWPTLDAHFLPHLNLHEQFLPRLYKSWGASMRFHLHSSIVVVDSFLCALVLAFSPLHAHNSFNDLWLMLCSLKRAGHRSLPQLMRRLKLWWRGH
jgi:hypothetical protein